MTICVVTLHQYLLASAQRCAPQALTQRAPAVPLDRINGLPRLIRQKGWPQGPHPFQTLPTRAFTRLMRIGGLRPRHSKREERRQHQEYGAVPRRGSLTDVLHAIRGVTPSSTTAASKASTKEAGLDCMTTPDCTHTTDTNAQATLLPAPLSLSLRES